MTIPTRADADALAATPKIVTALAQWRQVDPYIRKLEARVFAPEEGVILRLLGTIGRRNYSFVLLFNNNPIRKYTKHHRHTNRRTGEPFLVPHKHVWDPDYADSDCYIPPDIDPNSDVNEQFLAFCRECHIELLGGYQTVAHI